MEWLKVSLILLCALGASNAQRNEIIEKFSKGVDNLFNNGIVTDEFKQVVEYLNVKELFSSKSQADHHRILYSERGIIEDVICVGCSIFFDAVLAARRAGVSYEDFVILISTACKVLKLQPEHVCDGSVALQMHVIVKMMDETEGMTGVKGCAMYWQNKGCVDPNASDWTIDVHAGKTVEKRQKSGKTMKVLHITDIHYDPIYEPGTLSPCDAPVCCQYDSGTVTRPEDAAGYWTDYNGCDLSDYAIENSFEQMHKRHSLDIEYIYFTGDIVTHRVWATDTYNNSKDILKVLDMFEEKFPGIPVYPVVGNHEPHPLNVWPLSDDEEISTQWVFDLVAENWGRWLPKDTTETILKGGYYTTLVREGLRIIGLNSNVAYSANWWLICDDYDNYGQLKWLDSVLYEAEQNNESVHILSHIPTGDDTSYIIWAREFRRIVRRYSNTITGIFNGHSHQDELILYFDEDDETTAINVAFNGGSLTTFTDVNPNYKVYDVDMGSYEILDYHCWIFNVTEANLTPNLSPSWYKLYSFKEAYGLKSADPQDIFDLTIRMAEEKDKTLLHQFYRFKWSDGPELNKPCDESCMKFNLCTLVTSVFRDKTQCNILMDKWN